MALGHAHESRAAQTAGRNIRDAGPATGIGTRSMRRAAAVPRSGTRGSAMLYHGSDPAHRGAVMMEMKSIDELFDVLGKILLRCFVMGYVLLLLWFALYVFGGDALRSIQVRLFGLTAHEVDLVNYC